MGMKPNVPKCCSMAVQASTGQVYDPQLSLCGQTITFIGTSTFKFLGAAVTIHTSQDKAKSSLLEKLHTMLSKVDTTLLSSLQMPHLTWDLSLANLPISWVEKNLDTLATKFLKRWTGLAKSVNTCCLYLPKNKGGLQTPSISTTFKKIQCAKAASLMSFRDSLIRHLVSQQTLVEASAQWQAFKPFQWVVELMQEDPGASRKTLAARAKGRVAEVDTSVHFERCKALPVQGQTARQFEDRAADLWSQAVLTSPDHVMRFALNAVMDTLPHNANLHLWGKKSSSGCQLCHERQTLQHVLNHCIVALERRRYNQRHDDVLCSLFKFI